MIVQNIHNAWDMVYNQYRNTVYKTLEDPITQKKIVEVVQFLYTKEGRIEEPTKGRNVDRKV